MDSFSMSEWAAYRGHQVLITGGLGFMGLNLAEALVLAGARVRLMGLAWPERSRGLAPLMEQTDFIKADMRDDERVRQAVEGCEMIFNLAGRSGAAASNWSPLDDLDVNCRGHLTLLEACRQTNPDVKIIFPSSRLVYASGIDLPARESSPTEPLSIYGIHKLAVEKYHRLYGQLYGLRTVILRITNPYGPFQRPEQRQYGIINWFIHLALMGKTLPVYGDGLQLRDYVHIDDVVRAFLQSGVDNRADGQVFNVGSGRGIRFVDMVGAIVRAVGRGTAEHVPWPATEQRIESGDFWADTSHLQELLGWRPTISFEDGISRVIQQYRAERTGEGHPAL